jgi:hypothetical protein
MKLIVSNLICLVLLRLTSVEGVSSYSSHQQRHHRHQQNQFPVDSDYNLPDANGIFFGKRLAIQRPMLDGNPMVNSAVRVGGSRSAHELPDTMGLFFGKRQGQVEDMEGDVGMENHQDTSLEPRRRRDVQYDGFRVGYRCKFPTVSCRRHQAEAVGDVDGDVEVNPSSIENVELTTRAVQCETCRRQCDVLTRAAKISSPEPEVHN